MRTPPVSLWSKVKARFSLAESPVQNDAAQRVPISHAPIGSSGTEVYSGYLSEEYLSELQGTDASIAYDKMRRSDTQVTMLLSAVKSPILSANWDVEAADETPEAEEIKEFVKHCLFGGMEDPFEKTIEEALTCVEFGFVVFETTHKLVLAHPRFGSYYGIKRLGFRAQKTIETWNIDKETKALKSVSQWAQGDLQARVDIPAEFLLRITLRQEGDNFEGISMIRSCYGSWLRKNVYLKLNAIGIEKHAIPTAVGKIPEGKESGEQFDNFIAAVQIYTSHQSNYITLPQGWDIEFIKNEFDPSKVEASVDAEEKRMAKAFIANFLELGLNGTGSFSLGSDLSDFFLGGIKHIAKNVTGAFNQKLIPDLVKLKYGPQEKYPELKCSGIDDKAGKELAEIISSFVEKRVIVSDEVLEEHVRKRFDLPKKMEQVEVAAPVVGETGDPAVATTETTKDIALNGSQVTSMVQIVQAVAAGVIPRDTGMELIQAAFSLDQATADRIMGSVGKGFVPTQVVSPQQQFAENGSTTLTPKLVEALRLGEADARKQIASGKVELKLLMQDQVGAIGKAIVAQVMIAARGLPESKRHDATKLTTRPGVAVYKAKLLELFALTAADSLAKARKEVPKSKTVKLGEERMTLSEFDRLPASVKAKLQAKADLLIDTQMGDLEKSVFFQFQSSIDSTDSLELLEQDLLESAADFATGPSIEAGSGTIASQIVNDVRSAFFFDDEVLDEIDAFMFVNGDPQSDICSDLAGTIFEKDDPEADRYFPPLHHNCKSYIVPILKGNLKGKEIGKLRPSSPELEKNITLTEGAGLITDASLLGPGVEYGVEVLDETVEIHRWKRDGKPFKQVRLTFSDKTREQLTSAKGESPEAAL